MTVIESPALDRHAAIEESYRRGSVMYVEYLTRLGEVSSSRADEVSHLHGKAMGYVWGWQDGGGSQRHTNDDWRFSAGYGLHCLDYAQDRIGVRMAVRNAFEEWMRAGTINGKEC